MFPIVADGLTYLRSQSEASLLSLFWFTLVFELPRYTFAFITAAFFMERRQASLAISGIGRVSVIIAGHNEEHSIERCCARCASRAARPTRSSLSAMALRTPCQQCCVASNGAA